MHLRPKISGIELAFLLARWRGYSLSYTLWHTGVIKCKSRRTALLNFKHQVSAKPQSWRTPEVLLAYLRREFYTECTLVEETVSQRVPSSIRKLKDSSATVKRSFLKLLCFHYNLMISHKNSPTDLLLQIGHQ